MASFATFVYVNRYKNRTVTVRKPIKMTNRTNAFPNAMGAIDQTKLRPRSDHLPNAFFCSLTDRIEPIVVSEHTLSYDNAISLHNVAAFSTALTTVNTASIIGLLVWLLNYIGCQHHEADCCCNTDETIEMYKNKQDNNRFIH
jgi:hypothetical protein